MHTSLDIDPARRRPTHIRPSPHAQERLRHYRITARDLCEALGPYLVADDGGLDCPDAAANDAHEVLVTPAPGSPIRLGISYTERNHCRQRAARTILLAALPDGRRVHVVCIPHTGRRLDIITLWDPDTTENRGLWSPTAQIPTQIGARTLPYCRWILADPFNPKRPNFRPRPTT